MPNNQLLLPITGIDNVANLPPLSESYVNCAYCGESILRNDAITINGQPYCPDCVAHCATCDEAFVISETSSYVLAYDSYTSHSRSVHHYCTDHIFRCGDCGVYYASSLDEYYNYNDRRICYNCHEGYTSCDDCGCSLHSDDIHYCETDDNSYCESCYSSHEETNSLIREYEYKPRPIFHISKDEKKHFHPRKRSIHHDSRLCDSTLYMGIELEVDEGGEDDDGVEQAGLADSSLYYCKHDGSLNNGFEVVSHPATWDFWQTTDLGWMDRLKRNGYRSYSTSTCGMHIHVSRSSLSELDILKLLDFCGHSPHFISYISRRRESNLASWASVDTAPRSFLTRKLKNKNARRYEAINILPEHTIEFRIFRGTLNKVAFLRNIAFVQTLVRFVQQADMEHLGFTNYGEWLCKHAIKCLGKGAIAKSLTEWVKGYVHSETTQTPPIESDN